MGCGSSTPDVKETETLVNGDSYANPRQTSRGTDTRSPSTVAVGSSVASSPSDPPKPNKLKKIEIVPDVTMFSRIDQHAANTPQNVTASIPELAGYLIKPCSSQLEKIRALYQWVIKNVDYDVPGYMSGHQPDCSPETTLRTRLTVCSGYSRLFEALCQTAGIPVKELRGLSKGFGYDPEEEVLNPPKTDHAWNVVFISNEWRLIDCTWDAGHLDGKTFTRHEGEFYFLTDPEIFINNHFPYEDNMADSQKWQLLEKPFDLSTYSQRVKLEKHGFKYGLELVSHKNCALKVLKEAVITLRTNRSPLKGLEAKLTEINGSSEAEPALIERADKYTYNIRVRPLKKTKYDLQIFGNMGEKIYHSIVTYRVECIDVQKNIFPYPEHFGFWGFVDNFIEYGFDQGVTKLCTFVIDKGELEFEIPMQEVSKPAVNLTRVGDGNKEYDDYLMFVPQGSSLIAKMKFPHMGCYKLVLFARKHGQGDTLEVVANIFIECKKASNNTACFPMMYDSAIQYKVNLLEPIHKELPANTKVTFRFSSPLLVKAMITKVMMKSQVKNNVWEITETTPASGTVGIFGSDTDSRNLDGLFQFTVSSF